MSPTTHRPTPPVVAVVAAAGRGTRLGAEVPKAYVELDGKTLLEHSIRLMCAHGRISHLIVTSSEAMLAETQELVARVVADLAQPPVAARVVVGGEERADSVYAALRAADDVIAESSDDSRGAVVLIHDAARALCPPAVVDRVVDQLLAGDTAVIPVIPVTDTIKQVADNVVVASPERSQLRAVQTPQGFTLAELLSANRDYFVQAPDQRHFEATDDASLAAWAGQDVVCVDGDVLNFKITTPVDLLLAEALCAKK